jgi:hypothetical protein
VTLPLFDGDGCADLLDVLAKEPHPSTVPAWSRPPPDLGFGAAPVHALSDGTDTKAHVHANVQDGGYWRRVDEADVRELGTIACSTAEFPSHRPRR